MRDPLSIKDFQYICNYNGITCHIVFEDSDGCTDTYSLCEIGKHVPYVFMDIRSDCNKIILNEVWHAKSFLCVLKLFIKKLSIFKEKYK